MTLEEKFMTLEERLIHQIRVNQEEYFLQLIWLYNFYDGIL